MKTLQLACLALLLFVAGACNKSPQENAQNQSEEAAKDAVATAEASAANEAASDGQAVASVVYSNIAAASEAASKIAIPALEKSESKSLAKDLGNLIVKRIGATTEKDANDLEVKITEERAKIEQKAVDAKITAADKDAILKYGDEMIAAAKGAVGL